MVHYSWDPHVELTGQTVRAFFANLNSDEIRPYLDEYGIHNVDPAGWYSLKDLLEIMNVIAQHEDAGYNFVAIGVSAADLSPLTPEVEHMPFSKFLEIYADIYHSRHRGGDAGRVEVEPVGSHHAALILQVPYPDDVMYGLIYGFARRILPPGHGFMVYYDENTLHKDDGGAETIIHIEWD